jgi:hypothetical protein
VSKLPSDLAVHSRGEAFADSQGRLNSVPLGPQRDVSAHRGRMCRDIVDASSLRLVVPGRMKRNLPQQLTVLGHHPDVETVHQHDARLWACPTPLSCRCVRWRNVTFPQVETRTMTLTSRTDAGW